MVMDNLVEILLIAFVLVVLLSAAVGRLTKIHKAESSTKAIEEKIVRKMSVHEDLALLAGKRVLLVEDAPESQLLIAHILKKHGLKVNVADNGRQALDLLNDEDFDVILMDMQMPVLDGYSTTEILRKSGYAKPIISLTAHAMREDQLKCLASGCNEVLTKPVSQAKLLHTVSRYLN
jgi:CheY-like chemotaxis protein